jgi:hypothetical protein
MARPASLSETKTALEITAGNSLGAAQANEVEIYELLHPTPPTEWDATVEQEACDPERLQTTAAFISHTATQSSPGASGGDTAHFIRRTRPLLLIVVTGEKGGGGKTPVALLTASFLQRRHWSWKGVDLDGANQQFAAAAPDLISGFTLTKNAELDWEQVYAFGNFIGEAMKSDTVRAVVIDLGAARLELFRTVFAETGLEERVGTEIDLALFYNLIADHGSLSTLRNNMGVLDRFDKGAHWVVIRNAWKGEVTEYDTGTVIRPYLQQRGVHELHLKRLRDEAAIQRWGRSRKLLGAYLPDLPFTEQAVFGKWANYFLQQLAQLPFLKADCE